MADPSRESPSRLTLRRGSVSASALVQAWRAVGKELREERAARRSGTSTRLWKMAVALGLSSLLVVIGHWRVIDGDEGYYLMAARLISEGKALYKDFFFPQMPLLVHIYGIFFSLFGRGWYGPRLLSSLMAAGTGFLLLEMLLHFRARMRWALVGAGLYAVTGFVGGWFTLAKSFGATAFFLTLGAFLLEVTATPLLVACGGLALMLAVECRLYVVVAFPCAVLFLLRRYGFSRRGLRFVLYLTAGALAGALLLLPAIMRDWHNFYFGNWVFHSIREYGQSSFFTNLPNKRQTVMSVLCLDRARLPGHAQLAGLVVAALLAPFLPRTRGNRLSSYLWPVLFLVSLVPSPADPQYFCLLIPFLILEAVEAVASFRMAKMWPVVMALGGVFLVLGVRDLERFVVTGRDVPGVVTRDRVVRWSIPTVEHIARKIDAVAEPLAGSWWPGYFVSTNTRMPLTLANDFGLRAATHLTSEQRRRVCIVTHDEVIAMINRHAPRLFVNGNWISVSDDHLTKHGYQVVDSFHNAKIWLAR